MKYEVFIPPKSGLLFSLKDLSDSLWNIAILNAPYRTGNLRSNIKRVEKTEAKTKFVYDLSQAPYIDFLEKGIGRNKKHVGFIEITTVNEMVKEIIQTAMTGIQSFDAIPTVSLRTDKARNYERKILKQMDVSVERRINAFERATLGFKYNLKRKSARRTMSKYNNIEKVNINVPNDKYGNRFKFVNQGNRKGDLVQK
jgi:hypothetical protein